ncbi:MAG: acyltransferase [Planctomycetaceae bacterium]|nr:acyltransferase [Planctomycetaceae bacterium]
MSRVRIAWWRLLGVKIGLRCRLSRFELPRNPWDIEILDGVALDRDVVLVTTGPRSGSPRIVLGPDCYINRFTTIDASERIEIRRGSMIGPYCYITDHDHGTRLEDDVMWQPLVGAPVSIGEDVWLGAGVTILKGVTIGDKAVVGAGSVVTKSVPAGAIVAGVPSRVIGQRV